MKSLTNIQMAYPTIGPELARHTTKNRGFSRVNLKSHRQAIIRLREDIILFYYIINRAGKQDGQEKDNV